MHFKLVTYNIHKGFDHLGRNFILSDIRELIRITDADIVCLQEVVGENDKLKEKGLIDSQIEFLADECWPHYSYARNAVYDHGHHGNLILSKFPINNFKNIDLSTNSFESRGLLICNIEIPEINARLNILTTHLDLTNQGRQKQLQKIKEILSEMDDDPTIFTGDFNDWNKKVGSLLETELSYEETYKKLNGSYAKTFPAFFPFMPLDRIYAKNIEFVKSIVLEVPQRHKLSDHLPLLTEFKISEKETI